MYIGRFHNAELTALTKVLYISFAIIIVLIVVLGHTWIAHTVLQRVIELKDEACAWGAVVVPLVGFVLTVTVLIGLRWARFFKTPTFKEPEKA